MAGSGKTTYAKDLEARGYVRLSVDEEIWRRFGRYGVDYDPDEYERHTEVAREAVRERLLLLLAEGRDVVVGSSFWQRSRRQEYKQLIEQAGGRWRLVYLQADPAEYEDHRKPDGTGWMTMADPEGNLFCVERSAERA